MAGKACLNHSPQSFACPTVGLILHVQSWLLRILVGILLQLADKSSRHTGWRDANSPLFNVRSLVAVLEVVDELFELAVLELEVDLLDSLRVFEVSMKAV